MKMTQSLETRNPLSDATRKSRMAFVWVAVFSCAVNLLMLTGPLFMLQVYDRVLASRSVPTLLALFALVAVLYGFLALFSYVRSAVLSRIGYGLDTELSGVANNIWLKGSNGGAHSDRPLRDLTVVRKFISSTGISALFDLPWVPVYLAIVFMLHTWLGWLATAGALLVLLGAVAGDLLSRKPARQATPWENEETLFSESVKRNSHAVLAMGMMGGINAKRDQLRRFGLSKSQTAENRLAFVGAFTKGMRLLVQSSILALGAYLAILQEITAGTMIAAAILAGRALAPVDMAVGQWKPFLAAREAYQNLKQLFQAPVQDVKPLKLPRPKGQVKINGVTKLPEARPGASVRAFDAKPILQGLQFELAPGDGLGVIGPSASGKSSLARLMVGVWAPDRGSIRLDDATFDQWDRDELGKHIGYLPQSVEMFPGTIRQNIARFDESVSDEAILEAARMAGVVEMILNLPDGFSTRVGDGSSVLSGGQVQRIALARALLNKPALLVLDEPNSNLDADGETALTNAIMKLRANGCVVVVMAHRPSAIAAVNKVLLLKEGHQIAFGDKEEVLRKFTRSVSNISSVETDKRAG